MSIRPFFLATIFACAGLQLGFEIGAAETAYDGTSPAATHSRSSAPKRLPSSTLSALGTATRVAQIDDAFPATNDPGSIRPQAKATAVSRTRQSRAAVRTHSLGRTDHPAPNRDRSEFRKPLAKYGIDECPLAHHDFRTFFAEHEQSPALVSHPQRRRKLERSRCLT